MDRTKKGSVKVDAILQITQKKKQLTSALAALGT